MSGENEIYIVSVSFGYVLAWKSDGNPSEAVVQQKDPGDDNKAQRWIVEPSDEPNIVALKNAECGRYLNSQEQRGFGKVRLAEKQLWRIDSPDFVLPPGAVRLQPKEFTKHFLNHDGPHKAAPKSSGQKAHMWQWEQNWDFNTTWFLQTTGAFDALAAATSGSSTKAKEESDARLKDIESREALLAKKEEALGSKQKELDEQAAETDAKAKDLQAQQNAVKKREEESQVREEELKEREEELAQKDNERQKNLETKQNELQDKEAKLAEAEKEQQSKHAADEQKLREREAVMAKQESQKTVQSPKDNADVADYQKKLKDLRAQEKANAAQQQKAAASAKAKLDDLQAREKALLQRERDLEKRERHTATIKDTPKKPTPAAKTTPAGDDPLKALKERMSALEARLDASKRVSSPQRPAIANGETATSETKSCGHVLAAPPRKLNRRVVGLVYDESAS